MSAARDKVHSVHKHMHKLADNKISVSNAKTEPSMFVHNESPEGAALSLRIVSSFRVSSIARVFFPYMLVRALTLRVGRLTVQRSIGGS